MLISHTSTAQKGHHTTLQILQIDTVNKVPTDPLWGCGGTLLLSRRADAARGRHGGCAAALGAVVRRRQVLDAELGDDVPERVARVEVALRPPGARRERLQAAQVELRAVAAGCSASLNAAHLPRAARQKL